MNNLTLSNKLSNKKYGYLIFQILNIYFNVEKLLVYTRKLNFLKDTNKRRYFSYP